MKIKKILTCNFHCICGYVAYFYNMRVTLTNGKAFYQICWVNFLKYKKCYFSLTVNIIIIIALIYSVLTLTDTALYMHYFI